MNDNKLYREPINLKSPILIKDIPKELPGNAFNIIVEELEKGNVLSALYDQNSMPDETLYFARFKYPFMGKFLKKCKLSGNNEIYYTCLDKQNGCTVLYAGEQQSK
ncbi:hypothetical protein FACS1894132_07920 [Clostridia bacterium]|nr:hypothetical protein FACS1894132_07920 [Clostridia bacterium]